MPFQTSDSHAAQEHRPVRVAALRDGVFEEARSLASELPGWRVLRAEPESGTIACAKESGFLAGKAEITITVEAPPGIPSTTVHVRSSTRGGLFHRDRQNVAQFVRPFHRRVCL